MSDPRNRRPLPPSATGWAVCACGATVALYDGEPHQRHMGSRAHREGVERRGREEQRAAGRGSGVVERTEP